MLRQYGNSEVSTLTWKNQLLLTAIVFNEEVIARNL